MLEITKKINTRIKICHGIVIIPAGAPRVDTRWKHSIELKITKTEEKI